MGGICGRNRTGQGAIGATATRKVLRTGDNSRELARAPPAFTRRFFLQDFTRTGLAGAATSRNTETIFQLLQVRNTKRGRLANFPFGDRVA